MKAENRESNLRPIQSQDIPTIEAIMGQEWYQDILQRDKEAGQACVHFDVQSCLNASSFGLVALVQGQVVGVILARSDRDKLNMRLLNADTTPALMTLLAKDQSIRQELIDDYYLEQKTYRSLEEASDLVYQGEITLFILAPSARDQGLGRQLFQATLAYFKDQGVDYYFLHTDEDCTISFYQKAGLRQAQAIQVQDSRQVPLYYYLFDNGPS